MRLTLNLAMLLICVSVTACATPRPNVSLALGPIICPASVEEPTGAPLALDPEFVAKLSAEDQTYLLNHEGDWAAALDTANAGKGDALDTCADYNRTLQSLQAESGE